MAEPVNGQVQNGAESEIPRGERRLVGRALTRWEETRGARRFPSRAGLAAVMREGLEANAFLIAIGDSEDSDQVVESGKALVEALKLDPTGKKAIEVLPSATERGLSFCRAAAELKKPIADVGHFTNIAGEDVYYRSILLPLSDDQETVNYLLGAFSFKYSH